MVSSIAFRTRARTIDHLGREQIADCPTAVSELWKNAYDAYALKVALNIFDGDMPIATVYDDGHGMSHDEFIEKWLVIGTESKATMNEIPESDQNGLPYRERQGQKGIGRLSSANLGSLLLLISKREGSSFIASLIDWRLFENPFIYLQDIEIPIVEFIDKQELFTQISSLFDKLMGNVWGSNQDKDRDERIVLAWEAYEILEKKEGRTSTKKAIEKTLIEATFTERHIENWSVWTGNSLHGTAMLMGSITYDLEAQLQHSATTDESDTTKSAKDKLFQTLSNFTDPFVDKIEANSEFGADNFGYSVTAWEGAFARPIISDIRKVDYKKLEELEHVLEGEVDKDGIFRGKVKAFGEWLDGSVTINPSCAVPTRSSSSIGSFHIRVGTFEQELKNTTHPLEIHSMLREQVKKYGGFMVYRNGLRVMPYGREDNDFFEIEKRRTSHAGREFWSYRNLFGRVALTRKGNPNLRDKAGREGIIDNKAAKVFRDVIINILKESARRFYGSNSSIRKQIVPSLQESYGKQKAEAAQKKIRARKRREFSSRLKKNLPDAFLILSKLEQFTEKAQRDELPTTETELLAVREKILSFKKDLTVLSLGAPPNSLGSMEADYKDFRACEIRSGELIVRLVDTVSNILEKIKPKSARDIAYSEINRNAAHLQHRLRKWSVEAKSILSSESNRITALVSDRNKSYHTETLHLLDDLEHGRITLAKVLDQLEVEQEKQDRVNSDLFEPYISTLKSLKDSIDIETLVSFTMEESAELRKELDRLNSLAQLGITVEIIGHEIDSLETTVTQGLEKLPDVARSTSAYETIKAAHNALTSRLRFLSPLKLSGEKVKTWISGTQIYEFIEEFMGDSLDRRGITLEVTPEFSQFRVYEEASRIFPVFINLINNSAYWVKQSSANKNLISLSVVDEKIVISDDGPGVEKDDQKSLFTLFFTRKIRGGRGVGLYLCRANLALGGHTISYATDRNLHRLSGANFVIDFKGAEYV